MFPPLKYAKSRAKLRWVALIGGWAARAACWTPRCQTRPAESRRPPRSCPPPSPPPPPPPSPSPPQAARIPPSLWATPRCSLARRQCRTLVDWGWPRGRKECWQNRSIQWFQLYRIAVQPRGNRNPILTSYPCKQKRTLPPVQYCCSEYTNILQNAIHNNLEISERKNFLTLIS